MAYRADIEIAVRGAQELKRLQNEVSATSKLITTLNNYIENIGSGGVVRNIVNLQDTVQKAANAFNTAALNTEEATIAAKKYIDATENLNAGLRERQALLKSINDEERKNRLAAIGREVGGRPSAGYAGQIGPGAASPIGALVGQQSPVAERIQRTIKARQDEINLQQALLRLEEKSAAELNKKVQSQEALVQGTREVLSLIDEQNRKQRFLAGVSGKSVQGPLPPLQAAGAMGFPVALSMTKAEQASLELNAKKQEILTRMVTTKQQLSGLAANLQRLDQNSVVAIADAERAQTKLNAAKERELQISKQGALLAGNFSPIGGAANIPGSPAAIAAAQKSRREAASNAIIGGAFPLLFGQGAGASVGGGLGGALGGLVGGQFGFGLSLVGTAIGQTFDTAAQSAVDFSKALKDTGDASTALETALGSVDKSTKTTIQNLAKSGQQAAAAEASFQALAAEIGTEQAEAFQRAGEATTKWGSNLQKWLTTTYASVVLLGEAIEKNFPTGAGIQAPTSVYDLVEAQPQQTLTQEAQDRLEDLAGQNSLLEKQVALARLTTDASVDQRRQLERQIALQIYVNDATELERQLKQKLLSDQEYSLRLKAAELRFTQQLFDVENAAQQARQRAAEEARRVAEKAQREAERAAQKQLQTLSAIRNLEVSLAQETLESADIDVARTRAIDGEIAALKEASSQLQARLNVEARILDIQLEQQLSAEDITDKERTLYESIYKQQRANLEDQYQIKARTQQLDVARLQTARQILFAEKDRISQDVTQQRKSQLAGLQTELAFPLGGERLEAAKQQLEQQARLYEVVVPLQRELQDLETERFNIAESASRQELQDLDQRISGKTAQIELESQYLAQINATEHALLRQQQFFTRYGQLIQTISSEIAGLMTTSVAELVRGTKTAEQIFSDFLNAVGTALTQAAQQMIAQYIALGIAKLFAFGSSGSGFSFSGAGPVSGASVFGSGQAGFNPTAFTGGFGFRANGGPVASGAPYVVGERGPELFVPSTSGSVVPTSDLRAAMSATPKSTNAPVLNMSFETTNIGGVEYVSRDQLEAAMAATRRDAARDGAKRGMSMTLDKLQQSPGTRSRVGLR